MTFWYLDATGRTQIETDQKTWSRWMNDNFDRSIVGRDEIEGCAVSTRFIGYSDEPWETLVFGGAHNGFVRRYYARCDAEDGHDWVCRLVRGEITIDGDWIAVDKPKRGISFGGP